MIILGIFKIKMKIMSITTKKNQWFNPLKKIGIYTNLCNY
jgi:hypothetical protein